MGEHQTNTIMKLLAYIGTISIIFGVFYSIRHIGDSYEAHHPTLNDQAVNPDLYLQNARYYGKGIETDRSLHHLERAMTSIKQIEQDMDLMSSEKVEKALLKLEGVYEEISHDSLNMEDLNEAFRYTLNTLALAELRVSERYAEGNHMKLSLVALKYAQLHLKNAIRYADQNSVAYEKDLFLQVDSILNEEIGPSLLVAERINHVIDEIDPTL